MAPAPEITHPIKLMPPYNPNVAGNINSPEAIMLPTTSEVVVHNPICLAELKADVNYKE